MNTPLRRVGLAMLAMVALLIANATYIQVVKADGYRADPRNQRVLLDEYSRERGKLVSQFNGEVLANVKPTDSRLQYLRQYVNGPAYAPVTGYYSVRYGAGGLERAEDEVLNGSDPRLLVRRLSDVITGRDPRGGNVQLTINPRVQQTAYDEMTSRGYKGSVVALKPDTGEILGMVSTPSYDPNKLAQHDSAGQEEAWTQYNNDPNQPMLNRAINQTYPPGSTFKLITAAAAMEQGIADERLTAASQIDLPSGGGTTLENYGGSHCGSGGDSVDLTTALALSCNTAFAELAGKVGREGMLEQAAKFGIGGEELNVPMRVSGSTLGDIADEASLYQTGIGQRDVRLTPLQDAMVAAGIANGGTVMTPQLVKEVQAPDLTTIQDFSPETYDTAMSGANASALTDMMIDSEENTSGEGQRSDLTIASKTGTAEHGNDPKNTPPHAWYVAFAPADDPQVAVAVIVESGGDFGLVATGGKVAAGIGRATIDAALPGGS
ncbi:peptidoglycan glycosyltransferase [Tamaricihabitans halophyticus]|uniref:Peptidoglycan glycosyltransferase n=1 Tax=Tamaricihabitans halophyticus TaxID=1262583 RepID=A0A4R2R3H3_9PSEU|nr:penicillin-binding protein 2 [Tamaricihabitans halophyticus]TCP54061.1 peptidoglycan glycosyltransferase [Tamaricihabitans halophyticus]